MSVENIDEGEGERRRTFFFDTNVLAYAFDQSEKKKREICSRLVRGAFQGESVCYLSNQILGELYVVLRTRVTNPLSKEQAGIIVRGFIDSPKWNKVNYDHLTVRRALSDGESINVAFWDLLIAETMKDAGVSLLVTENVRNFRKISWIKPLNPVNYPRLKLVGFPLPKTRGATSC